jgi:two-component system chemotaxis response regulator CheY
MMLRILVVDDDEAVRDSLKLFLEQHGHEVITAKNGRHVVALCGRQKPNVVITDLIMPDFEGIELIIDLLKLKDSPRIVAMSGGGALDKYSLLAMARELGAHAVLEKPFQPETLMLAIDEAARCR